MGLVLPAFVGPALEVVDRAAFLAGWPCLTRPLSTHGLSRYEIGKPNADGGWLGVRVGFRCTADGARWLYLAPVYALAGLTLAARGCNGGCAPQ